MKYKLLIGFGLLVCLLADLASHAQSPTSLPVGARSITDDQRPRIHDLQGQAPHISHLKGQRFIDFSVGTMDKINFSGVLKADNVGLGFHLATGRYRRNLNAWRIQFSYARKPVSIDVSSASSALTASIPYALYVVGYGYEFNLIKSATRTRFVRGELSAISGYESINNDSPLLDISQTNGNQLALNASSRFGLGVDAGLAAEWQPFIFSIRQRWMPNSPFGHFHTFLTVGIRLTH